MQKPSLRQFQFQRLFPELFNPQTSQKPNAAQPGYRAIPANLRLALKREVLALEAAGDEDLLVVGKMIFLLKDPYSATKIRLPVKATACVHFECFDLDNFCMFHKIPPGVKHTLRKELVVKSSRARSIEKLFFDQQRLISRGKLSVRAPDLVYPQFSEHGQAFFCEIYRKVPPLYQCPLCDEKFLLKQLYISDIFNYFVKTTPRYTTRIEMVDKDMYKLVDDDKDATPETQDVLVLDSETEGADLDSASHSDFNDGLDEVLGGLGDGSWGRPVEIE